MRKSKQRKKALARIEKFRKLAISFTSIEKQSDDNNPDPRLYRNVYKKVPKEFGLNPPFKSNNISTQQTIQPPPPPPRWRM